MQGEVVERSETGGVVCLEVLQERGLIRFTHRANQLQIRIQPTRNKVDLEASQIMRALRSMIDL